MSRNWRTWLLVALAAAFLLLRFVHLSADYPSTIRWEDAATTDEGWYAAAAINQHTWGTWLLPGDFNSAVLLPVWPLIASGVFHVFGFGIVPLRSAAVVVFLLDFALLCNLVRIFAGKRWIPLFAVLIALNPWAFYLSRLGLLENPMLLFFLLAVTLAIVPRGTIPRGRMHGLRLVLSAVCFGVAMLTKTTAVALAPAFAVVLWDAEGRRWRPALRDAVIVVAIAGRLVFGSFWRHSAHKHPVDLSFFQTVNQSTFHFTLHDIVADISRPLRYGLGSDGLLFAGSLLLIAGTAISPKLRALWKQPLFAFAAAWLLSYLLFMAEHNNAPVRYYAALIPALPMLAIALLEHLEANWPRAEKAFLALLAVEVAVHAAQILPPMFHPQYSFRAAATSIANIVSHDSSANNIVLGDNSDAIALLAAPATLKPLNLLFHSEPLNMQMKVYQPAWYVQFQPPDSGACFDQVLSAAYRAEHRGAWPIFNRGATLVLYRLQKLPGQTLSATPTPAQLAACSSAPPVPAHSRGGFNIF